MMVEIVVLVVITMLAVVRIDRPRHAAASEPIVYGPLMVYGRLGSAEVDVQS